MDKKYLLKPKLEGTRIWNWKQDTLEYKVHLEKHFNIEVFLQFLEQTWRSWKRNLHTDKIIRNSSGWIFIRSLREGIYYWIDRLRTKKE